LAGRHSGGRKFLPPNPLPFCPPENDLVFCSAKGGAIIQNFVQNRFELRSAIAIKIFSINTQRLYRRFPLIDFVVSRPAHTTGDELAIPPSPTNSDFLKN